MAELKAPKSVEPQPSGAKSNAADRALSLSDRRSPELVFGLVGTVGSGVTTTGRVIAEKLAGEFGYDVKYIKASDVIVENSDLVDESYDKGLNGSNRIKRLQDIGNNLRDAFSHNYIIEKCIEKIATDRVDNGYEDVDGSLLALPRRQAHIVDSLKHPEEVALLRDVYGDVFWLVTVFAPEEVRIKRLISDGVPDSDVSAIMSRDEEEDLAHGQKVRKTAFLADFFVRNDDENDIELRKNIDRYLEILFNVRVHTPTSHESAMYNAVSASSKSACLSRQVGAAIYSKDSELIGVGWNDVPKPFGGLYISEDNQKDHRCYRWGKKICHNDARKSDLYEKVYQTLKDGGHLNPDSEISDVINDLQNTEIRNLIEFSRSVHAEMEAIISAARAGKSGLVGGRLYSTTFPCHSCARHIVASGISEVYYIEPYTKSLATDLHGDAVSTFAGDIGKKVVFLQYEGVSPRNIIRLFRHEDERKDQGKTIERDKRSSAPVYCPAMDGFTTHEQMIVKEVTEKERHYRDSRTSGGEPIDEKIS